MTKEDAIQTLKDILDECTASSCAVSYVTEADAEAFTMAIKSLERPLAKWQEWQGDKLVGVDNDGNDIYKHFRSFTCTGCRKGNAVKTRYCPHCGSEMAGVAV